MAKLTKETQDALNQHIRAELTAGYRYLASSAQFQEEGFPGMAGWMRAQAREELGHAMKFYDHVLKRNGHIELDDLKAPPKGHGSPQAAFQGALEREQETTSRIETLYSKATESKDYPLQIFLQWFIEEQTQEEESLRDILDRFELAGSDKGALLLLDRELGARDGAA